MNIILKCQIERDRDINADLFNAIAKAEQTRSLGSAYSRLQRQFVDSPIYWFYLGGHHIAVHSHHHEHRLAIITETQGEAA